MSAHYAAWCWLCYRAVLLLPYPGPLERVTLALLPYAGEWAYRGDRAEAVANGWATASSQKEPPR